MIDEYVKYVSNNMPSKLGLISKSARESMSKFMYSWEEDEIKNDILFRLYSEDELTGILKYNEFVIKERNANLNKLLNE